MKYETYYESVIKKAAVGTSNMETLQLFLSDFQICDRIENAMDNY